MSLETKPKPRPKPRRRRWGRTVLIVIFALIVLAAIILVAPKVAEAYRNRQVRGPLSFDPAVLPAGTYAAGQFAVAWDPAGGGTLTVTHRADPGKVLWSTLPGQAFVAAAQGNETVTESRGSFFIRDSLKTVASGQTIAAITATPDGRVEVRGHLGRSGQGMAATGAGTPYTLTFAVAGDNQLQFTLEVAGPGYNRTYLTYASDPDEHFFGFGEQFTYFDLKGKRVPIFDSEQGIGRGAQPVTLGANLKAKAGGSWSTTYAATPHYLTSRLRSLFLETSDYAVFDLRKADRVQVELFAPRLVGRILYGDTPAALLKEYTAYAGRMRPLPDWLLSGAVVGMQGGTDRVREVLAELEARGTPVAAVWLQDWVGQRVTSFGKQLWWNWELDQDRYPGWADLVAELKAEGVRVMTYVSPFLVDASDKPSHRRNLFAEARDLGYLVKDASGQPYLIRNTDFSAGLVDLTNPAAREWMKNVIEEQVIGAGASGWMADFGEDLPYDAVLASGEPAATVHNRYPELWAQVNREAVEEAAGTPAAPAGQAGTGQATAPSSAGDLVFFMRSAYTRSPAYATLFWEGDQLVSWDRYDGIKSAVTGLLSGGLSGMVYNHSDIGGYTAVSSPIANYHRSKELLERWMELSAFTTVYRTHEGNLPDQNTQFYSDAGTLAQFDRMARVYKAWEFYRRDLVQEASETGMPVVRALFLQYPDDPRTYDLSYQEFLVGTELLVAPVLDPGKTEVEVYFPKGLWVHVWTGQVYGSLDQGTAATVAAPIGSPAVFYRDDGTGADSGVVGARFVENLQDLGLQLDRPPFPGA